MEIFMTGYNRIERYFEERKKIKTNLSHLPANPKKLNKIMELSMDVTTYRHWAFDRLHSISYKNLVAGIYTSPKYRPCTKKENTLRILLCHFMHG
jgi:hypothetical protein